MKDWRNKRVFYRPDWWTDELEELMDSCNPPNPSNTAANWGTIWNEVTEDLKLVGRAYLWKKCTSLIGILTNNCKVESVFRLDPKEVLFELNNNAPTRCLYGHGMFQMIIPLYEVIRIDPVMQEVAAPPKQETWRDRPPLL
jgi:hypothetical protein